MVATGVVPLFPPIPIIINLDDKTSDISSNPIAYMGLGGAYPVLETLRWVWNSYDVAVGLTIYCPLTKTTSAPRSVYLEVMKSSENFAFSDSTTI